MSDLLIGGGEGPVGVVLAGGIGRRIGGSKAMVQLQGKPLICYPLAALKAALGEVAVIAKPDTALPPLPGVTVWIESPRPTHPLYAITQALALAGERAVLVCATDLPFVSVEVVGRLAAAAGTSRCPAAVAAWHAEMQPLLGCYQPAAARLLAPAALSNQPLRAAVAAIHPQLVEVDDPDVLFNVNAPEDLLQASAMLDRRRTIRT